jgi:SAM-dependent methyltransferase
MSADLNEPLPFADASFDVIVCALVIHYVDDRAAVLSEFRRVLRPAGRAVVSTSHPTFDWLHHGGSYFDTRVEEEVWGSTGASVRSWREPLTSLCAAVGDAGLLIERLVEPLPASSMQDRWPADSERLSREPGFLILKLLKPK